MPVAIQENPKTAPTSHVAKPSNLRLEEFDAVIEGTVASRHLDEWYSLGFHREVLYVPRDIGTLVAGHRRIQLYGRTHDFFSIRETPVRGNDHYPVALVGAEWPRSIVLKNGSIYVAHDLKSDREYMAKLPEIVATAGAFFQNGDFGN